MLGGGGATLNLADLSHRLHENEKQLDWEVGYNPSTPAASTNAVVENIVVYETPK